MDYEWHYFFKELEEKKQLIKSGSPSEERRPVMLPDDKYTGLLLNSFRNYRHASGNVRTALEILLKLHTEVCKEQPENHNLKRRHNALVYKYIVGTIASDKVIAQKLNVSKVTVYCDINLVIWEMAVLCLGVPILATGQNGKDLVMKILEQYALLCRCSTAKDVEVLFPVGLKQEVFQDREYTAAYLERFRECLGIYADYCQGIGNEKECRRNALLQDVYITGTMTIGLEETKGIKTI